MEQKMKMLKKVLIVASITAQVNAMEEPPCLFAMLPVDTCNYITQLITYDDTETENEFINRTRTLTPNTVPDDCKKHLSSDKFPDISQGRSSKGTLVAYSPHGTNVALLELLCGNTELTLKLVHRGKEHKAHNEFIPQKQYSHCALSSHATMFALIDKAKEIGNSYGDEVMCYVTTKTLRIYNTTTKKEQECDISTYKLPYSIQHPAIAFNKQGTHVIVHGIDHAQKQASHNFGSKDIAIEENPVQHHVIIPLTINTRHVPVTLQHYFEQKGICKQITQ